MTRAHEALYKGVRSFFPHVSDDGELHDPVLKTPTQYGTIYHAYATSVLARLCTGHERAEYVERARKGLHLALRHMIECDRPELVSNVDRELGTVRKSNHRDFFWPPILKTYRILKEMGETAVEVIEDQVRSVDILMAFWSRPPSNWSSVWLSGEWIRVREGLSPYGEIEIDSWLSTFFKAHVLAELGFYQEPGHPNSYDLFTRYHLADMLNEGYTGRHFGTLDLLMRSGLRRSLAVQLSDGSLASAHRSTGQTWTIGAQCAYFTLARNYFADSDPILSVKADNAAVLAFDSFLRWQRPQDVYSPVENCLPAAYRIGYETYTADGHYSNLALGFLAAAIENGFSGEAEILATSKETSVFIENDPVYRAIIHRNLYSVHINANPARAYDAYGIVDLTLGPSRTLQLVSSVRHLESGHLYNLGTAIRDEAGMGTCNVFSHQDHVLVGSIRQSTSGQGVVVEGRQKGCFYIYSLNVEIDDDGIHVCESTPGLCCHRTLIIPYLRDPGIGGTTEVDDSQQDRIQFRRGEERMTVYWDGVAEDVRILPYGYENRRGLCGIVRVDLQGESTGLRYTVLP